MKFGRIILRVNTQRLTESDYLYIIGLTPYFQDGGHKVYGRCWHWCYGGASV